MKKMLGAIIVLVILTVGLVSSASAQIWSTGIQVQNLSSTSSATVAVTFYNRDGTVADTLSGDVIAAGSSKTYYQPTQTTLPDGFSGSAVVSSDQPVAAIVNQNSSGPLMSGSYVGASAPAGTVVLPLMMKGNYGWDSEFAVQNTSSSAATVDITYYDATGAAVATDSASLGGNGSAVIKQADNASLPSGFVGSAVLTCPEPIVAVANQSNGVALMTYNGFTSGGQTVYVPLVMKGNYGWGTGVQVANLSLANPTDVTITYYAAGSTTPADVENATVQPGSSVTFYNPGNATLPSGFVGSAVVTSTAEDIAVIVNQATDNGLQGMSYEGFASGSSTVSLPLIMKGNWGWSTSFQVQNIGGGPTDLTVAYYAAGSTTPTHTDTTTGAGLGSGSSVTYYQPWETALPNGFVGSVVITASGGGTIVAICNEGGPEADGEVAMSYVGFNQ
jgi:hypothetical protein